MNEETAVRIILSVTGLVATWWMVAPFMFDKGLWIPLGRGRRLWLAPPAVPLYRYFALARNYRNVRDECAVILVDMRQTQTELDTFVTEIGEDLARLVAVTADADATTAAATRPVIQAMAGVLDNDRILAGAFAEQAAVVDALLQEPVAPTTGQLLRQFDVIAGMRHAWRLGKLRGDMLTQTLATLRRTVAEFQEGVVAQATVAGLDAAQRSIDDQAGALTSIDATLQALEQADEAQGRKPGRPAGSGEWTDDRIRALHAAYLVRGKVTAKDFAKANNIEVSYMLRRFRALGLRREP